MKKLTLGLLIAVCYLVMLYPLLLDASENKVQIDYKKAQEVAKETLAPNPVNTENKIVINDPKLIEAFSEFQVNSYIHTTKVFSLNYWSSILILAVMIILLIFGMWIAYLQFAKGVSSNTESTILISREKIEIKSQIVGLAVLTLSLGFFYLYLIYVYPITILGHP